MHIWRTTVTRASLNRLLNEKRRCRRSGRSYAEAATATFYTNTAPLNFKRTSDLLFLCRSTGERLSEPTVLPRPVPPAAAEPRAAPGQGGEENPPLPRPGTPAASSHREVPRLPAPARPRPGPAPGRSRPAALGVPGAPGRAGPGCGVLQGRGAAERSGAVRRGWTRGSVRDSLERLLGFGNGYCSAVNISVFTACDFF